MHTHTHTRHTHTHTMAGVQGPGNFTPVSVHLKAQESVWWRESQAPGLVQTQTSESQELKRVFHPHSFKPWRSPKPPESFFGDGLAVLRSRLARLECCSGRRAAARAVIDHQEVKASLSHWAQHHARYNMHLFFYDFHKLTPFTSHRMPVVRNEMCTDATSDVLKNDYYYNTVRSIKRHTLCIYLYWSWPWVLSVFLVISVDIIYRPFILILYWELFILHYWSWTAVIHFVLDISHVIDIYTGLRMKPKSFKNIPFIRIMILLDLSLQALRYKFIRILYCTRKCKLQSTGRLRTCRFTHYVLILNTDQFYHWM